MKLIEVSHLYFKYPNQQKNNNFLFQDINFEIYKNDFLGIVGFNGSGKTTLIKLLLGLLKPCKGKILYKNHPLKEITTNTITYVPQKFSCNHLFPINSFDIIISGLIDKLNLKKIFFTKQEKEKVIETMNSLNILNLKEKKFTQLSGGEKQKVLIARSIINNPEVIILDEPTANIDRKSQDNINEILKKLNISTTIIMVSHDLHLISANVNKVICISKGLEYHQLLPADKNNHDYVLKHLGPNIAFIDHKSK